MTDNLKTVSRTTSDRRLLKLAAFLDTVPRQRFNYETWVGASWQGAPDLSCGTTACALGWAASMPTFRRLGLHLVAIPGVNPNSEWESGAYVVYGNLEAEEAGAALFGLTFDESVFLFGPDTSLEGLAWQSPGSTATAKQVATHIRKFVKNRDLVAVVREGAPV